MVATHRESHREQTLPADARAAIIAHMNQDHAEALLLYARVFARVRDAQAAVMRSIDAGGMDLEVSCGDDTRSVRIEFEHPLRNAGDARRVLIQMARSARRKVPLESGLP